MLKKLLFWKTFGYTNKKLCFLRHFLFKPGGTSPMYCTTSPGYPLTSNTVYSPPPRPLPRNTFSRPAFSLKKPYKHCNWKCAALSAILISITLLLLLAYFIGKSRCALATQEEAPPLHDQFNLEDSVPRNAVILGLIDWLLFIWKTLPFIDWVG